MQSGTDSRICINIEYFILTIYMQMPIFLERYSYLVICEVAKGVSKHYQNGDLYVHIIFAYFEDT